LQKMQDFSKDIFRPERFNKLVDEIAAAIRPAVAEESPTKLSRFDSVVAGNTVEQNQMGPPPRPGTTQPATRNAAPPPPRPGPFGPINPIKIFAPLRAKSVIEQLAGHSEGLMLDNSPPTPPPPGRNAFGPGFFLAPVVLKAFDTNKDQEITSEEVAAGFAKWFDSWNTDKSGFLTREQLSAGLNEDLSTSTPGPFMRQPAPPKQ